MANRNFKRLPKASDTYKKIIKSLLPITAKKGKKPTKNVLPTTVYTIEKLKISRGNLNEYRKICGFIDTLNVPPTYFAVLSQSLQMNMMVDEPFPFAMLGLVHVENSVTQHRPISQDEIVKMSVKLDNLRDHDKGKQFDFVTTVESKGEVVCEAVSTYLTRTKTTDTSKTKEKKVPTPKMSADHALINDIFKAPECIGRRYAKISGDYNLIHIHAISAKALGFKKAIAHGMWSKAKCLALVNNLPDAYTASFSFKLPIFLPSKVELIVNKGTDKKDLFEFGLYDAKDSKPHLSGIVSKI